MNTYIKCCIVIIDHLISETGKILYITGTHGNQAGVSGLSHPAMLDHRFYLEDCMKVGVVPGPLPEDLQEKENNNNILFVFLLTIFAIVCPDIQYLKLWFGIAVLAFGGLKLGFTKR